MIGKRGAGILAGMCAAAVLSGCGVRDVGDDSGSGLGAATGSDTTAIQGFWVTNSGGYALISSEGEFTHITLDFNLNCHNFVSLPLQSLGVNQVSGNNQYHLLNTAPGLPPVLTPFDAFVGDSGNMTILVSNSSLTVTYSANTEFLPEDLQYCSTDDTTGI